MPETRDSVGFGAGLAVGSLAGESDDKIIRAAGLFRTALFVRAKSEPAGNLLGGGENFCEKPESMFASLVVQ